MSIKKPLFLLSGGRSRNPKSAVPYMSLALKECGSENPRIAYLGVANGDNLIFYRMMKSLLDDAGAYDVSLIRLAKNKADLTEARLTLENADAVFIAGGEVDDGMRWLYKHGLVDFLNELYNNGKLFFGSSAGTIMMGSKWVRWEDEDDDSTAELFDCLGFVPTTFDTHAEDEDWKELKLALKLQGPGAKGYGIPSDSMVIVDSQGQMTELGRSLLCYINNEGRIQKI